MSVPFPGLSAGRSGILSCFYPDDSKSPHFAKCGARIAADETIRAAAGITEDPTITTSDYRFLGRRIQSLRALRGMTQFALAQAMGFGDRQTLSDIETGHRRLQADELLRLADLLDTDLQTLTDPFEVAPEAAFTWLADAGAGASDIDAATAYAARLTGLWLWLEEQAGARWSPLVIQLRLDARDALEEAAEAGLRLAQLMDLPALSETAFQGAAADRFGVPVLLVDLPAGVRGGVCRLDAGAAVFVRRGLPAPARWHAAAIGLFHALTWTAIPPARVEVFGKGASGKGRRPASMAAAFAAGLLDGGTGPDDGTPNGPRLFSERFALSLHGALERGRLSVRKAARTVGLTIDDLKDLFTAHGLPAPFDL